MASPVFSRGLSNMVPLWQRIDICSPVVFISTIKKTFHSVFSFFFSKFEIVRQINAFGKPDLFLAQVLVLIESVIVKKGGICELMDSRKISAF
jgi:hypothetical protein